MYDDSGVGKELSVIRVLSINNQEFQVGFKVKVADSYNTLRIGCFDDNMDQMGYGIELMNE